MFIAGEEEEFYTTEAQRTRRNAMGEGVIGGW
jgi:hypothetical protein